MKDRERDEPSQRYDATGSGWHADEHQLGRFCDDDIECVKR